MVSAFDNVSQTWQKGVLQMQFSVYKDLVFVCCLYIQLFRVDWSI